MSKKQLTISEFREIIKEEVLNLKKRIILENEKKAIKAELKTIFEAKFDIETSEVEEFIDKIKIENPSELARFRSIVKNKGLDSAKERYKEIDPQIIAQKKAELSKEKYKETRKKWYEKNKERQRLNKEFQQQTGNNKDNYDEDELMMNIIFEPRKQKELARKFVAFLPEDFPQQIEKLMPKYSNTYEGAYYMLIGAYDKNFEDKTGIRIDFDNEYFEDAFEEMMYGRFGEEIEF